MTTGQFLLLLLLLQSGEMRPCIGDNTKPGQKIGPFVKDDTEPEQNLHAEVICLKDGKVKYINEFGDVLKEGDIIENKQKPHHFETKMATSDNDLRWTRRVIPYTINRAGYTDDQYEVITTAISNLQSFLRGCITFKPRTNETDYINIFKGHGCYSSVGRIGGSQKMSLGSGCTVKYGTVYHELMHALGFWHEHNRPDRNDYITVYFDFITDSHKSDYYRMDSRAVNTLGQPYDYFSVMHYSPRTFAKYRENDTFTVKEPKVEHLRSRIGQRDNITAKDIEKIRTFYQCEQFKSCANPLQLRNGIIKGLSGSGSAEVGSYIKYSCISKSNVLVGPKRRFCKLNGQWSGFDPQCLDPNEGFIHFCSFDDGNFCGWQQGSKDPDSQWLMTNRSTETSYTGPTLDHTFEDHTGYYIYMESSHRNKGDTTTLISPTFKSKHSGKQCISFYYHMYGETMGKLNITILDARQTPIENWSLSGNTSQAWHLFQEHFITQCASYQVVIKGIVGFGFTSDIGIDDIIIKDCNLSPTDPKEKQVIHQCDFNNGLCGWSHVGNGDFDWQDNTGNTPTLFTGPECDRTDCKNGTYMYLETSGSSKQGATSSLASPIFQYVGDLCMEFFYSMYGSDVGELGIQLNNGQNLTKIWTKRGDQGVDWHKGFVGFTSQSFFQITVIGTKGGGYHGDIAVDDFQIIQKDCKVDNSCDFEQDYCGWQNDQTDNFDWTRKQGSTDTPNTGPRSDHTSASGYYVYIESSAPRITGDKARIISPVLTRQTHNCLQMNYHMYGEHVAHLRVFLRFIDGHIQHVWKEYGNHGDRWQKANISLPATSLEYQVIIEGEVGDSYLGDIAVDDIIIFHSLCE